MYDRYRVQEQKPEILQIGRRSFDTAPSRLKDKNDVSLQFVELRDGKDGDQRQRKRNVTSMTFIP